MQKIMEKIEEKDKEEKDRLTNIETLIDKLLDAKLDEKLDQDNGYPILSEKLMQFLLLAQKKASHDIDEVLKASRDNDEVSKSSSAEPKLSFTHTMLRGNDTVLLQGFSDLQPLTDLQKEKHSIEMGIYSISAQLFYSTKKDSFIVPCPLRSDLSDYQTLVGRIYQTAGLTYLGGSFLLEVESSAESKHEWDYFCITQHGEAIKIISFQPTGYEFLQNVIRATIKFFYDPTDQPDCRTLEEWKQMCQVTTYSPEEAMKEIQNRFKLIFCRDKSQQEFIGEVIKKTSKFFNDEMVGKQERLFATAAVMNIVIFDSADYNEWLKVRMAAENYLLFMEGSIYAGSNSNMHLVLYFANLWICYNAYKIGSTDDKPSGLGIRRAGTYCNYEKVMEQECIENLTAAVNDVFENNVDAEGIVKLSFYTAIDCITHKPYF